MKSDNVRSWRSIFCLNGVIVRISYVAIAVCLYVVE